MLRKSLTCSVLLGGRVIGNLGQPVCDWVTDASVFDVWVGGSTAQLSTTFEVSNP